MRPIQEEPLPVGTGTRRRLVDECFFNNGDQALQEAAVRHNIPAFDNPRQICDALVRRGLVQSLGVIK